MNSPIIAYRANMVVQTSAPFANTYSLSFDGIDDKVSIGTALDLGINSTLSFWIKRGRVSTSEVWFGEDSYSSDYLVTITSSTVLYFRINTSYVGWNYPAVKTILNNTTEWVNVCIVRNGNSVELFLNGISYGTGNSNAGTPGATVTRFDTIGASPYGLHTLAQFDEIAAWNNNTVNPVDIYNLGTPTDLNLLPTPPLNWYRMGDNGSWKSPQWLIPNNENKDKVSNYSLDFDAVDNYVSVSDNSIGQTQNISYSIWVNLDVTTRQYIIGNQSSSNGGCGLQIESGDVLVFQMADGGNDSYFNSRVANFSTYAPINTWNHILATWNGTDAKIYINGVLRNTWSPTLPYTISGYDTTFNIGWRSAGFQYMTNGRLDELALFDSGISVGDVWDGSGQPIDVSAVSGITNYWKIGDNSTFLTNWTVPDEVGTSTGTSANMTIEDRIGEAPSSENNAVSFNMDEVDRVTDVPT